MKIFNMNIRDFLLKYLKSIKNAENHGGVLTNLKISQLLSALDYQNSSQINAKT